MADGVPRVPVDGALGVGCNSRSLSVPTAARDGSIGGFGGVDGGAFVPVRKVDILFVIDDSSETRLMQDNLVRNFPTFINRLKDPPGLPDLHLAVISTDMGAGDGSIAGCDATGGDERHLPVQPRARLHGDGPRAGRDVHRRRSAANRNYTGNLADVFGCIARARRIAAAASSTSSRRSRARWAPTAGPRPPENQGFLRPDAFLVIVV